MRYRLLSLGCLLVSAVVVSGCGKGRAVKVSGIVKLDGNPLEGAMVKFVPLDEARGMVASGRTGTDGKFRLTTRNPNDGALPGEYKVLVTLDTQFDAPAGAVGATGPQQAQQVAEMMRGMANEQKKGATQPKKKTSAIPAMYGNQRQTPFQKVVIPADQDIELELRSKGG